MNNIIIAKFSKGVYSTTAKVFKYDVGDKLQFVGLELPDAYRVDFANSTMGESKTVFCNSDTVEIPPEYFIPGSTIYAWIVLTQDNGRYTKYQVNIPILARAKPLDIAPTPAQQDALDEAIDALNNATEDIQSNINAALEAAKASGEFDGTTIWVYDGSPVSPNYTFYKDLMRANANAVVRQFDFILYETTLFQIISVSEFTCQAIVFEDLKGDPGIDGVGVPTGGTTGQVLKKASDADLDTEWGDYLPSGGANSQVLTIDEQHNATWEYSHDFYTLEFGVNAGGNVTNPDTDAEVGTQSYDGVLAMAITYFKKQPAVEIVGTGLRLPLVRYTLHSRYEFEAVIGESAHTLTHYYNTRTSNWATVYSATWLASHEAQLPSGGSTGKVLKKASSNNYDVEWGDVDTGIPDPVYKEDGDVLTYDATSGNWVSTKNAIYDVADAVATDYVGDLSNLDTTDKSNLVAAINEVVAGGTSVVYFPFTVSGDTATPGTGVTAAAIYQAYAAGQIVYAAMSIGSSNSTILQLSSAEYEDSYNRYTISFSGTTGSEFHTIGCIDEDGNAIWGYEREVSYNKKIGGIPKNDLAYAVQTSLRKADSAYQKPALGIPATDLAIGAQISLARADAAYQKPQSGIPASDLAAGVIPTVPTKTSDLTNDSGFITGYTETDPTVPAWAKAPNKPSYTASEVGALPASTAIPSKTSDLTNDSGFITGYTETDPTVPSWAKASSKPAYTASEVGAIAAPSSPATGAFLVWNGSAWVAQTLATWQAGSY